ncbi:MAG: hypothetical protein EOO29_32815, partial [Comamonadaceae bacterium]
MSTTYHKLADGNFFQDWEDTSLIATANDWSGVPSIMGYRGDGLSSASGTDPQTVTADGSATPQSAVLLGSTPSNTGAVGVFQGLDDPVVALQGSGTADAPHLVLHLDASGRQNIQVSYRLRDLDSNTDNAVQAIALQYRIGDTGPFINVPAAFVADASDGPSLGKSDTLVNATLPAEVNGEANLQLRIITNDAPGSDEWIGVDDISVTSTSSAEAATLTYTGSANESAAFDGSIDPDSPIVLTLSGDTFAGNNGDSLDASFANVPAGLTAVLQRTSDTTAELRFTGQAQAHAGANDVADFSVSLSDGAFTGGSAAAVTGANLADLRIDFADTGLAGEVQTFTPNAGTTSGSSDASTAYALDANWMVVGDDEASVLRVYHREGGEAVKEWNFETVLQAGDELDLEGGTRIGDTYYFTGSHSNKKSGAEHDSREYVFAVQIEGTGADTQFNYLGKHSGLEAQLAAWDAADGHGRGANYFGFSASSAAGLVPEGTNGFSIEGLAASADGSKLLLGFRAPQTDTSTRDKAVVVEVSLADLFSGSG